MSTPPPKTSPSGPPPAAPPAPLPAPPPPQVLVPQLRPTAPIMGGLKQTGNVLTVWTGGKPASSAWTHLDPTAPTRNIHPTQLRSTTVKEASTLYLYRKKGLADAEKFKVGENLKTFVDLMWRKMKETGMDTIAYLPSPVNPTTMLSILTNYPRFTLDSACVSVAPQLTQYDEFDIENDYLATQFLFDSLERTLSHAVLKKINQTTDPFPIIWMTFIHEIQSMLTSRYETIKNRLKNRKPTDFPGQNISLLAAAIRDDAVKLDNAGQYNHNLTGNIMDILFKTAMGELFFYKLRAFGERLTPKLIEVSYMDRAAAQQAMDDDNLTYGALLHLAMDEYRVLHKKGEWLPGCTIHDNRAVPAGFGANLVIQSTNKPSDVCHNCGAKGHWGRDCPNRHGDCNSTHFKNKGNNNNNGRDNGKQNGRNKERTNSKQGPHPRLIPPAPGEPTTKTLPGKTTPIHWCAKCKHWTSTHGTETHTGGRNAAAGNNAGGSNPGGTAANYAQFECPSAWMAELNMTNTIASDFIRFLSVLLLAALLTIVVGAIVTHRAALYVFITHVGTHLVVLWSLAAPILWASLLLIVVLNKPKPPFFDGDPVLDGRSRCERRATHQAYRRHQPQERPDSAPATSIRTQGFTRHYPRRLCSQGFCHKHHPTLSEQQARRDREVLHEAMLHRMAEVHYYHHRTPPPRSAPHPVPTPGREGVRVTTQTREDREALRSDTRCHKRNHNGGRGGRSGRGHNNNVRRRNPMTPPPPEAQALPRRRHRRQAAGRPRQPTTQDYQPTVGTGGHGSTQWPSQHEQAARKNTTQVQLMAMVTTHIDNEVTPPNPSLLPMAMQAPVKLRNAMKKDSTFPVIWDSGASMSISPNREDFEEYNMVPFYKQMAGFVSTETKVKGEGYVKWAFHDTEGMLRVRQPSMSQVQEQGC